MVDTVSSYLRQVLYIPSGCLGFLPSTKGNKLETTIYFLYSQVMSTAQLCLSIVPQLSHIILGHWVPGTSQRDPLYSRNSQGTTIPVNTYFFSINACLQVKNVETHTHTPCHTAHFWHMAKMILKKTLFTMVMHIILHFGPRQT